MTAGGVMEIETVTSTEAQDEEGRDRPLAGAEIELRMLELRHRIKNILMVVQTLVNQTLREGVSITEAREVLGGRLIAIGHAVDLLLSGAWDAASLDRLIRSAVTIGSERVSVSGPQVEIGSSTAMMLSILFHELECNAIKYGALSAGTGSVAVSWQIERTDAERLVIDWIESGGPPMEAPVQKGFGTTLVSKIATRFGGEAIAEFAADGLRWRFSAPLAPLRS
jgi:two-component sensor histidine kinase